MTDMLSRTIGRYEIKEKIGEGAMAMVYRAYDPEINRSVALKVLKDDFCVDEEYLARFLREAKAAGALSHPNIVTVFDVGKLDNAPYMMMELLDGKDLGEILAEKKKLPLEKALIIGLQLGKALDYAHKCGVVHRDIKPDNIIVSPDGTSIKVADFGIARMDDNEEAQKTQVGSVLGTPRYMSPEQALALEVDGRSDLFSVGVIMYEMLTGVKTFDAPNIGTLMTQITQLQPKPITDYYPKLPAGLRQIVNKLLHKKPEKRFQTGGELVAALSKELQAVKEQKEEQSKHKYVPLKVRWSLYMGTIVAAVMLISISVVFNIQSKTMTKQAVDSGASFAKFIATETAISLLSEDWITLETFITEAASRDTFSYLVVVDRLGIIRGASDLERVGLRYEVNEAEELILESDGVKTTSIEFEDGNKVFNINAPVLFQDTEVGHIVLGLSQDSLDEVKSVTGWLMFSLALVIILSVVAILFVFGGLIIKPLNVVTKTMQRFAAGDMDARISLWRNDEIGELFDSFNSMAAEIQRGKAPEGEAQKEDALSKTDMRSGLTVEGADKTDNADVAGSETKSASENDSTVLKKDNSGLGVDAEKERAAAPNDLETKVANTEGGRDDPEGPSVVSAIVEPPPVDMEATTIAVKVRPKKASASPKSTSTKKPAANNAKDNKPTTKKATIKKTAEKVEHETVAGKAQAADAVPLNKEDAAPVKNSEQRLSDAGPVVAENTEKKVK